MFLYNFNVVFGLLDALLELKESIKHESDAGKALDLLSIQTYTHSIFSVNNGHVVYQIALTLKDLLL